MRPRLGGGADLPKIWLSLTGAQSAGAGPPGYPSVTQRGNRVFMEDYMSSRIEQLIDEIEEYIDSCKYQPLSSTKIIVNKEEIDELLRDLRMKTPDEIKRYQKIISNKALDI